MYQEAFFAALTCIVIMLAPMRLTFISTTAFILNLIGFLATIVNIIFKLRIKKIQQYNSVVLTGQLFASEAVVSLMHFRANDKYDELDEDAFGGMGATAPSSPRERSASIDNEVTKQRLRELATLKEEIEEYRKKEEEEKRLAALRNPYADEDVEVLEQQLKAHNIQAARFIPLPVLKSELSVIMSKMQSNEPFDERRLDYLFRCLAFNKDYIAEQQEEHRLWQESVSSLTNEYLVQQRAYIPVDIFSASLENLVQRGLTTGLAKRLLTKKCLWLLRMPKENIAKLHEADLMGRYNPQGQNLDIVELLAIYAACPTKFDLDTTGKKEAWRAALEESVKAMMKQKDANNLIGSKLRNPVYKGQSGMFPGAEMYVPAVVPKETFGEKDPFLASTPQKLHKDKQQSFELEMSTSKNAEDVTHHTLTHFDPFLSDHYPPHKLPKEAIEHVDHELLVPSSNHSIEAGHVPSSDSFLAGHHPPQKLSKEVLLHGMAARSTEPGSGGLTVVGESLGSKPKPPFLLPPPPRPLKSHKKTVDSFKIPSTDGEITSLLSSACKSDDGEGVVASSNVVSSSSSSSNNSSSGLHAAPSKQLPQDEEKLLDII
jgi:hypothetical protein